MKRILLVAMGFTLSSCFFGGEPSSTYKKAPKQSIDLLVNGKDISEVYIDSTPIPLKKDNSPVPVDLDLGSHIATWRFNSQEMTYNFVVEKGAGSLTLLNQKPFVQFTGSVSVQLKPN